MFHLDSLSSQPIHQPIRLKRPARPVDPYSPPIELTSLHLPKLAGEVVRKLHVVREDKLPGGTKQRAIIPFLEQLKGLGLKEMVYASPFCGFAQLALALGGQNLGIDITLFCEADPATHQEHQLTEQARQAGAQIFIRDTLSNAEQAAQEYADSRSLAFKIPLGFNHPSFLSFYESRIREQFSLLSEQLGGAPKVLWLPVGSGTLRRVFSKIVPATTRLECVNVRVLPLTDPRIAEIAHAPNVGFHQAELLFQERCTNTPPVPSNLFYDAKVWEFICRSGKDGDVWWNVAK